MTDEPDKEPAAKKEASFWDSSWAFGFLVAAILLARFYVLEPFKIPSGSMEPTLIGHEDYGDRIVTNKLAYVSAMQAGIVLACAAAIILAGFIASKSWRRLRSIVLGVLIAVGVLGGIGFLWTQGAVAGEPRRFDVVVFQYETEWSNPNAVNKKINYIKRLIGLPGETLMIAGGNLFKLNPLTKAYEIIRMWQTNPALQESLWYPVSKAWVAAPHSQLTAEDAKRMGLPADEVDVVQRQFENLALPWDGAGAPGAKLEPKALLLDGGAPVTLTYKYPVTNIHLKHGRWPFRHEDCPAASPPPVTTADGVKVSSPDRKSRDVMAYVANTWEGVQCPNCRQIVFPLSTDSQQRPLMAPVEVQNVGQTTEQLRKFFYSSPDLIGDLKLDLEIDVTGSGGKIAIDLGSNLHQARWVIPSDKAAAEEPAANSTVHPVSQPTPPLQPGKHRLSLAYVDATVIATLDGVDIDHRLIDVAPPKERITKTLAQVTFEGVQGRVTRLDLSRNLIHIIKEPTAGVHPEWRRVEDDTQIFKVPSDHFLMLGDNGPSSADSRVWGFVPRSNLVGRASFIWWPPSRWRIIR